MTRFVWVTTLSAALAGCPEHWGQDDVDFSTMQLSYSGNLTASDIDVQTAGTIPEISKNTLLTGIVKVSKFVGVAGPFTVYMTAPGAPDSDYEALAEHFCTNHRSNWAECEQFSNSEWVTASKQGDRFFVSPSDGCVDGKLSVTSAPLIIHLSTSAVTRQEEFEWLGAHEYLHVVQSAKPTPRVPSWLREGSAVQMQCIHHSSMTYQECMQHEGGGGEALTNARDLYATDSTTNWLKQYEDRTNTASGLINDQERWVYYDSGAWAVAFAISKSKTKRSVDFWNSKTDGFWSMLVPVEGGPTDDTTGWRKAFLDYLNGEYASVDAFYTGFAAFMRGEEADQMAILESTASLAAQVDNPEFPDEDTTTTTPATKTTTTTISSDLPAPDGAREPPATTTTTTTTTTDLPVADGGRDLPEDKDKDYSGTASVGIGLLVSLVSFVSLCL